MTFHTTALVLSVRGQGEHDRRAHLYTQDHGKLEVFVKSARKCSSKLSPHLEPLTLADCYIVRGRLDHLAGIERIDRFSGARISLSRLTVAAWAFEIVDALTKADHPDARIFALLHHWATFIERSQVEEPPARYRAAFTLTLLGYLGYNAQLEHCVRCGETNRDAWFISARDGGICCQTCPHEVGSAISCTELERATLATNTHFNSNSDAYRQLTDATAQAISDQFLAEYLPFPLRNTRFSLGMKTIANS